jgi:hypothetical protein
MKDRRDELITRRILLLTKTRGEGVGEWRGSVSGNVEKTGRRFVEFEARKTRGKEADQEFEAQPDDLRRMGLR